MTKTKLSTSIAKKQFRLSMRNLTSAIQHAQTMGDCAEIQDAIDAMLSTLMKARAANLTTSDRIIDRGGALADRA